MVAWNNERSWRFGRAAATAGLLTVANIWAVGCGGTSVNHGDAGQGGDDGSAGSAAASGGTSAGAMPVAGHGGAGRGGSGAGGTSASGGSSRGGSSVGGTGGAGGTGRAGAGAGGAGTGGTAGGGTAGSAGKCPVLDCDDVPCPDGVLVEEDCACPVCRCDEVACAVPDCADGQQPFLPPGACCPVCPDPNIDSCTTDSGCVLAFSTLECCDCPQAVSQRHYEQDACLVIQDEPRDLPDHCVIPCPAIVCAPCPPTSSAVCVSGMCTAFSAVR